MLTIPIYNYQCNCPIRKPIETVVKGKKIGRNDPCPCGSGKKYKKCCIDVIFIK